jgi:2-C-methyl-D-erythritol 4-phosphate cytidylyltransferase
MGFDKLFSIIAGKPVVAHTIDAFERTNSIGEIVLVTRQDRLGEFEKLVRDQGWKKIEDIVTGGEHRQDSVRAGLQRISKASLFVAVHDAARPLVTPEQIERVYQVARANGAASSAEPVTDTLKRADRDLVVTESADRHHLYGMQTPQVFAREILEKAYRLVMEKEIAVTDEVSAVEQLGQKIVLVPNERANFKITYPRDLPLAEFVLKQLS